MIQGDDKKAAQSQTKTHKNTKKVEKDDEKVEALVESKDELLVSFIITYLSKLSNRNSR